VAARNILMAHRAAATPVAVARNLGRADETLILTTLGELDPETVDMLTLVLVGNSETRLIPGREPRIYTPRGYQGKTVKQDTESAT
jgi:cobalt-precorrin 5A hydrolase/precorrin-3B C17-methyltransferase